MSALDLLICTHTTECNHALLDGKPCICGRKEAADEIAALRARLADAERVANAAKNIMAGIEASRPGRSHELPGCPHGNIPFYPTHGWWCDGCFGELEEALAALKDGQP